MLFLDANILLEITLQDREHFSRVQRFLETVEEETAISMLTAHLIMHFGRKARASDAFLHGIINENELLGLTLEDYAWAIANERGRDFEDALQMAAALRSGCKTFVTLDAPLAKAYAHLPITIIVPAE